MECPPVLTNLVKTAPTMTKTELLAYLDGYGIAIEIYGPRRERKMRLAPPRWMTRAELVDHVAIVGVYLKQHRDAIYQQFTQQVSGWSASYSPFHARQAAIKRMVDQYHRDHETERVRLACSSSYNQETLTVMPGDNPIPPWMTTLYLVDDVTLRGFRVKADGWKQLLKECYLPYSEPPPRWKVPGRHWRPPADWNNTIGWEKPKLTKAELAARFRKLWSDEDEIKHAGYIQSVD